MRRPARPARKPAAKAQPTSSAAARGRVAREVAGVDAIEVKATVADHQIADALVRFSLTEDTDQERFIYFFDTPQLALLKAGIIARARRVIGSQHDSTVKFRPVVPHRVPREWGTYKGFKLEADASEKGVVRSASLTVPVAKGLIKDVAALEKEVERLFSKKQEGFLHAVGGRKIDFDILAVFGPLAAQRWQFADPACPWPITAELWRRADGARLMEVSIKAPAAQAAVAIAGFMAFLSEVGAERNLDQETKTRWALACGPSTPAKGTAKAQPSKSKPKAPLSKAKPKVRATGAARKRKT